MTAGPSAKPAEQRFRDRIERPVLIVSTPRSGSTLLFETLVKAPGLFSAGGESHARIEQVADFFPGRRGWTSNRLDESDATPHAVEELARSFHGELRDRDGKAPDEPRPAAREDAQERAPGAVLRRRLAGRHLRLFLPRAAADPGEHDGGLGIGALRHLPRRCPAGAARPGRCCSPRAGASLPAGRCPRSSPGNGRRRPISWSATCRGSRPSG